MAIHESQTFAILSAASDAEPKASINLFQKYLSLWILLAIILGIVIGTHCPSVVLALESATIAQISIPIAVLLWGMILPMMMQIEWSRIVDAVKQPKPILITSAMNYAVQPFTMYALSLLFFKVIFLSYLGMERANEYLIGSVLLSGAPCTAMVFVWSRLMNGDAAYTVAQVAVNDILLLFFYIPTVKLLAGASDIAMPWDTLSYSILIFVAIPLLIGVISRVTMSRKESWLYFLDVKIIKSLDKCSMVFLVLMVSLLFISQAKTITHNLIDILIISIPLFIQTVLIWGITFVVMFWFVYGIQSQDLLH